ncbi:hypothetical protein SK128_026151, partial [Halocaridina rubra]
MKRASSHRGLSWRHTPDPTLKTAFRWNLRSILRDPADFLADIVHSCACRKCVIRP